MSERTQLLQRKCACGGHAVHHGECEECKKKRQASLQRKAVGAGPGVAPPIVHDVLASPGQPLDSRTRHTFEPRFRHSFANVRVHTDAHAAASAQAVSAAAYTVGENLVFDAGQYTPGTSHGDRLLAHELTHVVQQRGAAPTPELRVDSAHSDSEREAERLSAAPSHVPGQRVQRTLGGALAGGLIGGLAGAGLGSIFGPVGAIVGGLIGLVAGALLGNLDTKSRKLKPAEIAAAKDIFKDSINYSKIEITRDSLFAVGAPRTIGNTIHLKSDKKWQNFKGDNLDLSDESSTQLRPTGEQTLIHEMTHVWQYQNGGIAYMPQSIISQIKASAGSGSRNAAYDYKTAIQNGVPWEKLNPEQQAKLVENYNIALRETQKPGASPLIDPDSFRTVSTLLPYIQKVQAGEGAPQFFGSSPAKKVQKKSAGTGTSPAFAPSTVHAALRTPATPLDTATRDRMEPVFGHNFGAVRLHTGALASQSARDLNALAYTVGPHIIVDRDHYSERLLAHELAHVVQQSGRPDPGDQLQIGSRHDPEERDADLAAERAITSRRADVARSPIARLRRQAGSGSDDEQKKDPKPLLHKGDWVFDPKVETPLGGGSLEDLHKAWCYVHKCDDKESNPCPPQWKVTKGDDGRRICCPDYSPDKSRCCEPENLVMKPLGYDCRKKQSGDQKQGTPQPPADSGINKDFKVKLPPVPSLTVDQTIHFQLAKPASAVASESSLKASLTEGGQTDLQMLIDWLVRNPNFGVQLTGLASSEGDAKMNTTLGANRARSIANVLIARGIGPSRFAEPVGATADCPAFAPGLHNCGDTLATKPPDPNDRVVRARLFILPEPQKGFINRP